jgi:5-methylcytosine-specific restriction endonuclease McrA
MTGREPWARSTRRARLPANWAALRVETFEQKGRVCLLRYAGCTGYATEVDHIVAGDDHSAGNRQPVCEHCHRIKTSREGLAARPPLRRPPEAHPALK